MTEYLVIFFLVIGAIVAVSVYVQRALQARIHDARDYMIEEAAKAREIPIKTEYEPYYGNVASIVARQGDDTTSLIGPGGGTGIFRKRVDQEIISNSVSQQAPPKEAR
jgi:hypothetical protein